MKRICVLLVLMVLAWSSPAAGQARVDKNVIYGSYSGLALLMDVHYPNRSNGRAVIFVAGNAWQSPQAYDAPSLKDSQVGDWAPALLDAGYTVFALNHRAAPRFHYPAPVDDVQRAVRYIRFRAQQFRIDPARIGGVGGSSGAHLLGLVAMLAAPGITDDPDPANRESAALQAVVLRAGPSDLRKLVGANTIATAAVVSFLDRLPTPYADDQRVYRAASPVTHVSASAPPVLLIHGDADDTVPYQQSVDFEAALRGANVPVRLLTVAGGVHGSTFGKGDTPHQQFPQILTETVGWLDRYLK